MNKTDNKSILFLTLSFLCIWVILDNIFGKRYLDTFLSNVFPFYTTNSNSIIERFTDAVDTAKKMVNADTVEDAMTIDREFVESSWSKDKKDYIEEQRAIINDPNSSKKEKQDAFKEMYKAYY